MSNTPDHSRDTLKLLIAILAFAIVMQISTGGTCGGKRYKRSTDYVESRIKGFIDFAKDVVKQSAAIISAVIDAMPETEDYDNYRAQLQGYLITLEQYKKHSGICAVKSLEVMTAFLTLTESFGQDNTTAEAQNIFTNMQSNGLLELEDKAEAWMATFDEDRFQHEYNEMMTSGQNANVSSMFKEIC